MAVSDSHISDISPEVQLIGEDAGARERCALIIILFVPLSIAGMLFIDVPVLSIRGLIWLAISCTTVIALFVEVLQGTKKKLYVAKDIVAIEEVRWGRTSIKHVPICRIHSLVVEKWTGDVGAFYHFWLVLDDATTITIPIEVILGKDDVLFQRLIQSNSKIQRVLIKKEE